MLRWRRPAGLGGRLEGVDAGKGCMAQVPATQLPGAQLPCVWCGYVACTPLFVLLDFCVHASICWMHGGMGAEDRQSIFGIRESDAGGWMLCCRVARRCRLGGHGRAALS